MAEEKQIGRRRFLGLTTWAIGGVITAGLAIPAIAYIIGPALKREEAQDWIRLGPASKVEIGTPTLFKTNITQQTGWIVNERERASTS